MNAVELLGSYFGYKTFRPAQEEIINEILSGRNVLAVLPTGAGKSICYQIPALLSKNFSIVISPLIALMKDQVDSLNREKKTAAFINSSMNFTETEKVLQSLAFGEIKILYVAPERVDNLTFGERIKKLNPEYIFIDEAHCISEWGHNFRPSYRKIIEFINYLSINKVSAFTATATPEVIGDIVDQLGMKDPRLFVKGFERENIHLNVLITKQKKEKALELINRFKTPAVIYAASRKKSEKVSEYLNLHKVKTGYYHAGLMPEIRKHVQESFLSGELPVIAATNAFGMGIDKKDIRLIIHYNMPGSIENFYQEIGRAGRDGKDAYAFLLYDEGDLRIHKYFLDSSHPSKDLIIKVYDSICDYSMISLGGGQNQEIEINEEYITAFAKQEVTKGLLHSCINFLEAGGYLQRVSKFEKNFFIQFLINSAGMKKFIKETNNNLYKEVLLQLMREFGSALFQSKVKVSIGKLSSGCGLEEDVLEEILDGLNSTGIINFDKPFSKESVRLKLPRIRADRLILNYKKINESYLRSQKKLDRMTDFVYTGECRFKFILNYFGEDTSDYRCGKCDRCIGGRTFEESTVEYIKELMLRTLGEAEDRFTENNLINILRGDSRIEKHRAMSTFGTGSSYSKNELLFVLHNLYSTGLINKEARNKISLSAKGFQTLMDSGLIKSERALPQNFETDLELFNLLREARTAASKRFMQPSQVICNDQLLREIANKKPKSRQQLLSLNGFNERTFNKVGNTFLDIIGSFEQKGSKTNSGNSKPPKKVPANIKETLNLLNQKYSLKDIASLRKLNEAVISMQVETIIEYFPEIEIDFLFKADLLEKIYAELRMAYIDLKELKSRLSEDVSYPLLRIASAKFRAMKEKPH